MRFLIQNVSLHLLDVVLTYEPAFLYADGVKYLSPA